MPTEPAPCAIDIGASQIGRHWAGSGRSVAFLDAQGAVAPHPPVLRYLENELSVVRISEIQALPQGRTGDRLPLPGSGPAPPLGGRLECGGLLNAERGSEAKGDALQTIIRRLESRPPH